jgi:hypothetical protein
MMQTLITQVSDAPVSDQYVQLRREVFFDELRWFKKEPRSRSDLLDEFDEAAEHYAIYADENLAAIARLIVRQTVHELPSGSCFPNELAYTGLASEISKCAVNRAYRGRGLFRALICHSQIRSIELGVEHVFIGVIDTPKAREFSIRERFEIVGAPFLFHDDLVAPPDQVVLLTKDRLLCQRDLLYLATERDRITAR